MSSKDLQATLDSVVQALQKKYSYLWIKQNEFSAFQEYMTKNINTMENLGDFVEHATKALSFFSDLHLYFIGVPRQHNNKPQTTRQYIAHEITDGYLQDTQNNGPITTGQIKNIAYIRLNSFDMRLEKQFAQLFSNFPQAEQYIIDLRANPGGTGILVRQLISKLQGEEKVIGCYHRSRTDASDCTKLSDFEPSFLFGQKMQKKRVIVLTSPMTASAAELATCYLQGIGAVIVGSNTFGGLSGQDTFYTYNQRNNRFEPNGNSHPEIRSDLAWEERLSLRIPKGILYSPKFELVQMRGISPDIKQAYQPENGKDPALETAVYLLK